MAKRDLSPHRLHVLTDLDRKTINRMLAGKPVRPGSRALLAKGLSREGPVVHIQEVPTCGWRIRKNPRRRSIFTSRNLESSGTPHR